MRTTTRLPHNFAETQSKHKKWWKDKMKNLSKKFKKGDEQTNVPHLKHKRKKKWMIPSREEGWKKRLAFSSPTNALDRKTRRSTTTSSRTMGTSKRWTVVSLRGGGGGTVARIPFCSRRDKKLRPRRLIPWKFYKTPPRAKRGEKNFWTRVPRLRFCNSGPRPRWFGNNNNTHECKGLNHRGRRETQQRWRRPPPPPPPGILPSKWWCKRITKRRLHRARYPAISRKRPGWIFEDTRWVTHRRRDGLGKIFFKFLKIFVVSFLCFF